MIKSDTASFFRLLFCYQSDLPHLIPLEIVSDLIFSAVPLTARTNNRGDPVHSCHISFSVMWIILVSVHIHLWRDKVKDQFKTANTFLQIHIWQYCKWVNIANMYWLLFLLPPTDPKLSAKYSFFYKWHLILPDVAWAISIHCEPHLLWECYWLYRGFCFFQQQILWFPPLVQI